MMDDETLRAIEERAKAATAGPWHALPKLPPSHADHGYRTVATLPEARGREPLHVYAEAARMRGEPFAGYRHGVSDAAFIAHARTDIPLLLAEVRRLGEARSADIVEALDALSDEEYVAAIGWRCIHCGKRDPQCGCGLDAPAAPGLARTAWPDAHHDGKTTTGEVMDRIDDLVAIEAAAVAYVEAIDGKLGPLDPTTPEGALAALRALTAAK